MAEAAGTHSAEGQLAAEELLEEIEYTGRKTGPTLGTIIGIIAALWSLFQLWIASPLPFLLNFGIITDVPARGIHLSFGLLLTFLLFPAAKALAHRRISIIDIALALIGMGCALYLWLGWDGLVSRSGKLLVLESGIPVEAILGGMGIVLLLEATRRAIGIPLVIVATIFLIYSIFGQMMPDIISHRGVSLNRLIGYHWLGGEAIFGIPIDVSVSFVFLFVLFGALLDRAGAGKYFLDLAFAMVGRYRGGPAKAAILASGMTGLISGSSIANVVTTGVFTIPVMRQTGLPAIKAGAIEVAASTNGQMMPPIMGAAAFIMAELIGISYFEVIKAAFMPAIISYLGLLYVSHLEAMKLGLKGMPKDDIPPLWSTFMEGIHFIVPIAILVYLLMIERWTASSAVFWTIMVMFLIMIGTRIVPSTLGRGAKAVLYAIPIAVTAWLRAATTTDPTSALVWGLAVSLVIILGLMGMRQVRDNDIGGRISDVASDIYGGLIAGARNMIGIAVAVATAGIIVGAVSSTGLNNAMVGLVEALSGGNVFILLILTAVLSLVLGMGLPTTANYLVVASLLAGVLVELGNAAGLVLPIIAVHLFVFYFGLMADSTPPVCLAAFAAAAISRADPIKTGVQSFLYDIRTAVLPFVFIFNTELLLIGVTSFWHGLTVFFMALIAMFCFTSAVQGWLVVRTNILERVLLLVVMFALFRPDFFLNQVSPAFKAAPIEQFIAGELQAEKDRKVRFHITRQTDFGDRFKLFTLIAPGGAADQKAFGLELRKDGDKFEVANVGFTGPAGKAKIDFGDIVTAVDVEQIGRPAKEWVYPLALALLGLILGWQMFRRRTGGTTAPAAVI